LGQNQGFRQTVTAEYFEEVQSQVLQRYYMLTFTYNIRKFGQGSSEPAPRERDPNRQFENGGPPRGGGRMREGNNDF